MIVAEAVAMFLELDQTAEFVIRVPGEVPGTLDEHEPHTVFMDRDGSYRSQAEVAFRGGSFTPAAVLLAGDEE